MTVINFNSNPPPTWLSKYYDRGFRLLFYSSKKKGPEGAESTGWTDRSDLITDYREGRNVGVFTGTEISPGKWLVDIDFDWPDGLPLAKHILPPTGFGFGRESRKISHSFYTSPEPIPSMVFENLDGKPFVELRGTKNDLTPGLQTMLPPSIHPTGEVLEMRMDDDIGHVEDLVRRVSLYATACMLFSQLGHRGLLHDNRLALAGFLFSEGLTESEVMMVGCAIAESCANNVDDFKIIVKSTAAKIKAGEPVQGRGALIKTIGDEGKRVISRIKEWLGGKDFIEDSKGKIQANSQENVIHALEKLEVKLSFDDFAQKPMVQYASPDLMPLQDAHWRRAWFEIDTKFKFRPDIQFFREVVKYQSESNPYHPVKDYLSSIVWDGEPRLDGWLMRAGSAADSAYVKAVSSIMMIAAVRRVRKPGCKYDEMVVLESGEQGLLKSSALRMLCPEEKWFSDDLPLNVDAKQMVERTLGKWIIEASDLSGMHASQVEHLKGMLSRQVDGPVRLAYAHLPAEQPRRFIIVGTTNSYTYLTDSTGNRRFWPIRVQKFDIPWLKANRDQLWAEAASREESGESIRLDPSLYGHASLQQERRRAEDPWETILANAFPRTERWRLSVGDVWGKIGVESSRWDDKGYARILKIMHALEFRRMTVIGEDKVRGRGFGRDIKEGQFDLPEEES